MARYEYRCPRDGVFEVRARIGEAAASARCGICGAEAGRVFSAPLLSATPRPLARAIDRAERSAEVPEVVSRIPDRRRSARPR